MINHNHIRFNIISVMASFSRNAISTVLAGHTCLLAIMLSSLYIPAMALAQTQIGTDIDGEAAGDISGASVSLSSDGSRVAIGAPFNDGNGDGSGHVRVYHWSEAAWMQVGADIDGEAVEDFSGTVSLSMDGDILAIGAPDNDGNGGMSGHVRIYKWLDNAWEQLGGDIDGEAAGDGSGTISLSSDGHRVAIGAPWNDGNGDRSGHVRVFQWSGTSWQQLGADIDGAAAGDYFGKSVSLSPDGNRLAVGSNLVTSDGKDFGYVSVFQWENANWTQIGADIDCEAVGDWPNAVSLSANGTHLAIGAKLNDGNGVDSGHVRVYQWVNTNWQQLGVDIDGEAADDWSGDSVSLSSDGSRLAISAPYNDGNGTRSGHVRVFQWSGTSWQQIGTDIDGEAARDGSGGLSLSADGNRLAIGAPDNDGNGDNSGQVRVYDLSMFNTFTINAGMNDAWYNPDTSGQGFFITVFPDLGVVLLAWFTYDTELPPMDAIANLGDAGHRWLTAVGPIDGNQALMNIEMTSGGIFDAASDIIRTDPPGSDGTLLLTFDSCSSGTIEYDIPSINRQGIVPIQRVASDNIVLCEALGSN